MRSRRISTQQRPIIGSSSIPARCTRSRTPKPPSSARNSTYRSDTTPKWIRKRRPRRPSSLPLTFKNRQKRPPTWWPFLSVAESSHHDQIQTGNRRGLHGCSDLKLLDFGFASKSRQTSLAGPLRTSLLCVYARSWPNANFFLVVTKRWRGACKSFPMVSQAQKRYATTSHKCLISLARSERFELPTLG